MSQNVYRLTLLLALFQTHPIGSLRPSIFELLEVKDQLFARRTCIESIIQSHVILCHTTVNRSIESAEERCCELAELHLR